MAMTRRTFLQLAAAATAVAASPASFANPLGLPIGCQTYPVRKTINTDFEGTMKGLRAAGFTNIELCSPYGYSDFSSLQKYKPKELSDLLKSWGLTCISAHWGANELFKKTDESIAYAKEFGMTQMAIAALGPFNSKGTETLDDVKRYVEPFNAFAEKAHAAGITALLHNEGFVSKTIDGKRVYDVMIAELDPTNVKLQFQVSTQQEGFDAVEYFHKYRGRYLSMHCQDWVKDASTKSGFRQVPIGQGVVDWKSVFAAAKVGGVQNYFVELEEDPALMPPSVPFLKKLTV
ncbi:sugar phosphate isomerase/epimerase family protein [Terriglobus roseus]|uniref:Tat (Twin-arginine translocation) pathway signal sequence n=1 Tax=Terriglobus roseus TaxID=392734 RepID=A0A1G7P1U4_9BACT|nr:TIM barrel protein [Terriglobus roseus]SDF80276.1 Tat (twin-arginine translocation) pathway signal sequence [Terriglobus roseus]